jgi:N-methylhydantoinase A
VDLPPGSIHHDSISDLFQAAHHRLYGYAFADEPIEIVNLWAVVTLNEPRIATPPYSADNTAAQTGERPVFIEGRSVPAAVYQRFSLAPGDVVPGPAIIEQADTTTLILPRQKAVVDVHGNLVLRTRRAATLANAP